MLLDILRGRVHPALNIACRFIASVMHNPFVMNQTRRVGSAEILCHLENILPAVGLVTAGPEQHTRVVAVTHQHGFRAVKYGTKPLLAVARQCLLHRLLPVLPGRMRFQVCLIDHIEPVLVTQPVKCSLVRVMGGAHGVDIIALHIYHILKHFLVGYGAPANMAELVSVGAVKHNAFPVDLHQSVLQFKLPETDLLRNNLTDLAARILHRNDQGVKIRLFRAP